MLRTAQSLPPTGLSTLGFDPARYQTEPPACYRAPWQLPGRDSHPLAAASLCSDQVNVIAPPPKRWAHVAVPAFCDTPPNADQEGRQDAPGGSPFSPDRVSQTGEPRTCSIRTPARLEQPRRPNSPIWQLHGCGRLPLRRRTRRARWRTLGGPQTAWMSCPNLARPARFSFLRHRVDVCPLSEVAVRRRANSGPGRRPRSGRRPARRRRLPRPGPSRT